MNGLNEYDYGARRRETGIPVWTTIDPLCEKYYNMSPYAYVGNNPVNAIDPNGEEIWIYYNNANENQQKLQYTQGMKYEGDNAFVSSAITALNQMNSTEIGGQVLGELVESKNQFDFTNTFAKDKNGNDVKNALSFEESKNGGGEIHAGALIVNKMQEGQNLESTAHELFHGYQYEKGQTMDGSMRTVNNEVGAYLFGRAVYYSYELGKGGYGDMPWGNSTTNGRTYQNAMEGLMKSQTFNSSLCISSLCHIFFVPLCENRNKL